MANYNKGYDIVPIINLINDVDSDEWSPDDRKDYATEMQVNRYNLKERMKKFDDNKCKLYSLVIGKCIDSMHSELKGIEKFK